MMTHYPRFTRQSIVLPALLVALSYAALVALAAGCAFGPIDRSGGHAHHGTPEAAPHNAFCAWACQAASDAVMAMEPSLASSRFVVQPVVAPSDPPASSSLSVLHSRAPPSGRMVLIG